MPEEKEMFVECVLIGSKYDNYQGCKPKKKKEYHHTLSPMRVSIVTQRMDKQHRDVFFLHRRKIRLAV